MNYPTASSAVSKTIKVDEVIRSKLRGIDPMRFNMQFGGLLNYSDMHGCRIKEHIEEDFGRMWSIKFKLIYPNLKKLEKGHL